MEGDCVVAWSELHERAECGQEDLNPLKFPLATAHATEVAPVNRLPLLRHGD